MHERERQHTLQRMEHIEEEQLSRGVKLSPTWLAMKKNLQKPAS